MRMAAGHFIVAAFLCSSSAGRPQSPLPDEAQARFLRDRVVQVISWGMPAVETEQIRQEMLTRTQGKINRFIYWTKPLDYRNPTLALHPGTINFMLFFDTKEVGPLVLEVPPAVEARSLDGAILTVWQTPLVEIGLHGIDKGRGGRFVILPPGYAGEVPADHTPLRSYTYTGYALLRVKVAGPTDNDLMNAIGYG